MDSRQPKWWEFWRNNPEPETYKICDLAGIISEPVRSIVRLMIIDRKRFIIQKETYYHSLGITKYDVLDLDTEEEFFIQLNIFNHDGMKYRGPSWAKEYEIIWAVETLEAHYNNLLDRAWRIKTARERNRLIEIYAR